MRARFVFVAIACHSVLLSAQTGADSARAPWTVEGRVRLGVEYDGNPFRLPASRVRELATPSIAQLASQRYARMESGDDVIVRTRLEGILEGPGLGGRTLRVWPRLTYERYSASAARSNVALGLELEQDLPKGRRLQLHADYVPSYFHRNYLADAVDLDLDLSIQGGERVYGRGDYREFTLSADYQHRLLNASRSRPMRVWGVIGVGISDRKYDAPFAARNSSGPTMRVRLRVEPRRTLEFMTTYDLALLSSPVLRQVILVDEVLVGEDLNANGNATDLNVRLFDTVDRSRTEHVLEQRATLQVNSRLDLVVLAAYRWRRFTSRERYDLANNDRRDNRIDLGLSAEYRLRREVRLFAGADYSSQRLDQLEDLAGEGTVDDYKRSQVHAGVRLSR